MRRGLQPSRFVAQGNDDEVKHVAEKTRRKARKATKISEEVGQILQKAMVFCLRTYPMLWTTGGLPEEHAADDGSRHWIIHIYLRYPTGHEGYLGDLLYDGKKFTELTERADMKKRAKQIAADPKGIREWNEYRASTVRAKKT
jgi:hypothetical protein